MYRIMLSGLLAVLAFATSAQAQFFFGRQGADPRFGGGGFGFGAGPVTNVNPYFYGGGLLPGGVFGPGVVPFQQPTAQDPSTLSPARQAGAGLADPGSPMITGHPTRFAAYAGYFGNQGGAGAPTATVPSRMAPTATPIGGVGAQLAATPTSRTRGGGAGPSQTPRR